MNSLSNIETQILNDYKLNNRQLLALTKVANFGFLTAKMLALYFAIYYKNINTRLQTARNTITQLQNKNLIKKLMQIMETLDRLLF